MSLVPWSWPLPRPFFWSGHWWRSVVSNGFLKRKQLVLLIALIVTWRLIALCTLPIVFFEFPFAQFVWARSPWGKVTVISNYSIMFLPWLIWFQAIHATIDTIVRFPGILAMTVSFYHQHLPIGIGKYHFRPSFISKSCSPSHLGFMWSRKL